MTILAAGTHILVFPFPAQGHLIPLLDLTHKLVTHHLGFTVTILVTPKNLPLLDPLLSANPSIKTLVLPFPSHPSIPSGVENLKDLPQKRFIFSMIRCLGQLYDPLVNWFNFHPSPPLVIISDMFLGWTFHLAKQLNVRRIVFSPSGAMALSVIFSLWRDMPAVEDGSDENDVVSFSEIPNCPKYPWCQISPVYRSYVKGDPESEFIKEGFLGNIVSWGLVINSVAELEGIYLDYLKKELGHDRVWAVGPLLPPNNNKTSGPTERGGPSSIPVHDVMTWLDKCEDHKVVYVCFGSQTTLTNDQMEELASSLEISGINFIWCVKDHGQYNKILSDFEDRVAGRGLIIRGWAPQVLILSHRAVGAFLTHCGWNSVLEGIVAGLPMLAWPIGADQFVNASLLVDELKVGVRVCEGAACVPNSVKLARVIRESVSENRVQRERVWKLKGVALDAIKDHGSSVKDFNLLVENMERLKLEASHL